MGRDLSPNHLCPYLQGGENYPVCINGSNNLSDIFSAPPWLGSLLPWLPLIPSPSCPSLLAKLALSSLLALLAGVLLLQVLLLLCSCNITFLPVQVTIQESREGLAVWLLWGFFELIMKVANCVIWIFCKVLPKGY